MVTRISIFALPNLMMLLPLIAQGQPAPSSGTLFIDGFPGEARIVVVQGKRFVDLDAIVQVLRATQTTNGEAVTIYLNPSNSSGNQSSQTLSRDFLEAGIEVVSAIREWRQVVIQSVENNPGYLDQITGPHQRGTDTKLALAAAAVHTDGDRSALELLRNESRFIHQFSDRYVERAQKSSYVSPEEIEGDPLGKQILDCARGMASMATSHQFQDVSVCH